MYFGGLAVLASARHDCPTFLDVISGSGQPPGCGWRSALVPALPGQLTARSSLGRHPHRPCLPPCCWLAALGGEAAQIRGGQGYSCKAAHSLEHRRLCCRPAAVTVALPCSSLASTARLVCLLPHTCHTCHHLIRIVSLPARSSQAHHPWPPASPPAAAAMPLVRGSKATPAIVSWSGDWRCSCGSTLKLWCAGPRRTARARGDLRRPRSSAARTAEPPCPVPTPGCCPCCLDCVMQGQLHVRPAVSLSGVRARQLPAAKVPVRRWCPGWVSCAWRAARQHARGGEQRQQHWLASGLRDGLQGTQPKAVLRPRHAADLPSAHPALTAHPNLAASRIHPSRSLITSPSRRTPLPTRRQQQPSRRRQRRRQLQRWLRSKQGPRRWPL